MVYSQKNATLNTQDYKKRNYSKQRVKLQHVYLTIRTYYIAEIIHAVLYV